MTKRKISLWTGRFVGITLVNVLLFFGYQLQMSALPVYIRELSGSDAIVGICTGLGTAAALMIRPCAGYALDRIGRKPVLFFGAFLMICAMLMYRWFPFVGAILVIRFILGLGWGISTTSSNTIVTDTIPKERFGEGMGYFSLSQSLSLALAPMVGLAVMEKSSYYTLMYVCVGMLAPVLIGALILRFKKIMRESGQRFVPYERSAIRPSIIMVFAGMGIGAVFAFAALYGRSKGFENVGLFFTFYAVTMFVTRPLIGRLIDRFGFIASVVPGFIGYFVSMVLLFVADSQVAFLAAALLQGASYGAVQTSLQTMAIINSPAHRRGAANATFFTGFDAGIGLGNLTAGLLANAFGYSTMFGIMSIPMLIGLALFFFIARKIKILRNNVGDEIMKEAQIIES